jgi:hypothetical protein
VCGGGKCVCMCVWNMHVWEGVGECVRGGWMCVWGGGWMCVCGGGGLCVCCVCVWGGGGVIDIMSSGYNMCSPNLLTWPSPNQNNCSTRIEEIQVNPIRLYISDDQCSFACDHRTCNVVQYDYICWPSWCTIMYYCMVVENGSVENWLHWQHMFVNCNSVSLLLISDS